VGPQGPPQWRFACRDCVGRAGCCRCWRLCPACFRRPEQSLAHLANTILPELLLNTFGLIVMVGTGTVLVGTGCAWLVSACRFPGSRQLQWLLLLPLAMPAYIIGYAYTDFPAVCRPVADFLRELTGWTRNDYWFPEIHSLWGVSLMLVLVLYPYVYFLARTAFIEQSRGLLDVARTLGRGPWGVFFKVALPMARPAIVAGAALALMEALADFGTVQYFGVQTFTTPFIAHGSAWVTGSGLPSLPPAC
jgi:iron(III) transport system permease protein